MKMLEGTEYDWYPVAMPVEALTLRMQRIERQQVDWASRQIATALPRMKTDSRLH